MKIRKILVAVLALLLAAGTATAINQEYRQEYDWRDAADHSGVTWDGIQDHPNNQLVQGYKYGSITEGLVGYWSFEDKKGKVVDQALDNDGVFKGVNNGQLKNFNFDSNSGWTENAKRGSHALKFDGEDEWVNSTKPISYDGGVSFSAWFKTRSPDDGSQDAILTASDDGNPKMTFQVQSGDLDFHVYDGNIHGLNPSGANISADKWYHVVAIHDGNNYILYLNGDKEASTEDSTFTVPESELLIGRLSGDNGHWFNGTIDDIRHYSKPLSSSEISNLYDGENINRSNLVAEYGFDQGSGSTAYDTSQWRKGKLGEWSGEFDGEDDWIQADTEGANIDNSFTVGGWVNVENNSDGQKIYNHKDSAGDGNPNIALDASNVGNGEPEFRIYARDSSGTSVDLIGSDIRNDGWTHVLGTVNSNGEIRLYENGNLINSKTATQLNGEFTVPNNKAGIGAGWDGSFDHVNGSLDSIRLYDRALSSKEVQKLYNQDREQKISAQDTLQSGLVGWWPLHETSGSTASDLSGNDNDGSLNGGVTQGVAGRGGLTAYSFDGSDDSVRTGVSSLTAPFTVSSWVKLDSVSGSNQHIASMAGSTSNDWYLREGDSSEGWQIVNDKGGSVAVGSQPDSNRWYQVAAVIGDKTKLFVDGELIGTASGSPGNTFSPINMHIGSHDRDAGYTDGTIGQVRAYDRALSTQEINQLYQQGAGDYATPPDNSEDDGGVAYWSFDNDDGDRVVNDEWGNHDGVLGNQDSSTHPSYVDSSSVNGEALTFDGSNDYVDIPSFDNFDQYTVSFWSKFHTPTDGDTDYPLYIRANNDIQFREDNTGDFRLTHQDSAGYQEIQTNFDGTSWNHWVGWWNGTEVRLYRNGHQVSSQSGITDMIDGNDVDRVGAHGDSKQYMDGEVDEVRVYNRSLQKHEIHELYQHGTGGRDMRQLTRNQGLVGYWSLDEDSGQTAYDLSGHGNNGTLGSSDSSDSSDPTQGVDGVLGTSAYEFDGSEIINSNYTYSGDHPVTFSTWVKPSSVSGSDIRVVGMLDQYAYLYVRSGELRTGASDSNLEDGNNAIFISSSSKQSINADEWTLGTIVWEPNSGSNGELSLYVDGEKIATESTEEGNIGTGNSVKGFRLGNSDGSNYYNGYVDEVRIYNRSLTDSEVQSLYSTSKRGEITKRSDFRSPTRTGLKGGNFMPEDEGNLSVEMVGAPGKSFSERLGKGLNGSHSYLFNWSGSYRVFDTNIRFDNKNVSTSPSVGGFAVNISKYVNDYTRQFKEGVKKGVKTSENQIKIGNNAGDDSLVGYWNFETKKPGTVTDKSGNNNDGTFEGDADGTLNNFAFNFNSGWVGGKRGNALRFDGSDDRVELRDESSLHVGANFTVASWVKVDEEGTNNVFNNRDKSNLNLALATNINNGFRIAYNTNGDWYATTSQNDVLDTGEWAHIAATSSQETGEVKIFLDGERLKTKTPAELPEKAPSEEFVIGDESGRPGIGSMDGTIDEVMLYDKALDESKITKIKDGDPPREGLVGEWTFDEGEGTTVHDTSNWKKGIRQGKSLEFDGEDDWVDVPHRDFGDRSAVAFWLNPDDTSSSRQIILRDFCGHSNGNEDCGYGKNTISLWGDEVVVRESGETNNNEKLYTGIKPSKGEWTHVAIVDYGDRTVSYENGEISNSKSMDNIHGISAIANPNGESGNVYYDGKIESLRVYSNSLSKERVKNLYNPSPGTFTSEFFNAGKRIDWQSFSWQEDLNSGNIEGRVQTASEVKETSEYSEWVEGSSSFSGPTNGLVGYWRFENPDVSGNGGTVKDWSGNNNDGTTKNGVDTNLGGFRPQSNAYSFDGSNDYMEIPDDNSLDFGSSDFTVSTWVKPDVGTNSEYDRILIKYRESTAFYALNYGKGIGKKFGFEVRDSNSDLLNVNSDGKYSKGSWHHIAGVRTGDTFKLYVNGQIANSVTDTGVDDISNSAPVYLGAFYAGGFDRFFEGKIDEARIYSKSLSSSEIRSMYTSSSYTSDWIKASNVNWAQWKQTRKGTDLKPMAQWRFEEGSGQYANDSVGDNDGTLGGSTSSESSDPTWREECRYRGCLEFDGSNDYVDTGISFDSFEKISLSFWLKPAQLDDYDEWLGGYDGSNVINFRYDPNGGGVDWLTYDGTNLYGIDNYATLPESNEWTHVVGTFDGSDYQLYYNGNLQKTVNQGTFAVPTNDLLVGARNNQGSPDNFADGRMDNFMIYNRSISSAEINSLYNAPSQSWASTSLQVRSRASDPESDSLVASYNFEGVGQTVMDASGSGNSGTLGSSVSESSNDPQRVQGYSGQGLEFDSTGSDDKVTIPNDGAFNVADGEFSWSMWVYMDDATEGTLWEVYKDDSTLYRVFNPDHGTDGWIYDTSGTQGPEFSHTFTSDVWKHIVVQRDSSNNIELYVNGELKDESITDSTTLNIDGNTYLGWDDKGGTDWTLDGKIDGTRFYNQNLSQETIQDLYKTSKFSEPYKKSLGTNIDSKNSYDYYQFKLNSLTGTGKAVPEVESVSLANVSGWSAWSPDNNVGLDLSNGSYVQAQFNLTGANATSTPVLESFGFGVPREPVSLNARPVLSNPDPNNRNIDYRDGELSVRVEDSDDLLLTGSFVNVSGNEVIDTFSVTGNSTVTADWGTLPRDSEFEWAVNVNDGVSTTTETYNFTTYDVNLTWTDNSTIESGFRIYSNLTGSYGLVESVPANTESYLVTTPELQPGRFVCYRVRAYNSAGSSAATEQCIDTDQLTS